MKASQEFSGGIAVIRGSASALSSGDNVKKLLNADSTIEAEIMKLNDKKMEKEIRKEWNKGSKDALKRLPDTVQEMSKLVQKKPEQLSDFDEFFKKAQKVTFGDVDCYVLSATLGSFKNPADLGGILKSLEHVRFNKVSDKLKFASGSIQPLQKYLDSVLGVVPKKPQLQKAPPSNQTTATGNGDEESSNLVLYIVLVIVFVLLIAIAVFCYVRRDWIKSKMQKKKEDKDSVNVEEGEVKASKTSGSKDAAKLKKGTGKTATTTRTESKVDETKTAPAQQFSSKAFKKELASRKDRKAIREAKIAENVVIVDGNVVVADDEEKTLKYPKKEPIKPNFVAVTKLTAAQKKEHDEIKNDIRKDRKRATQLAEMTGNKFSHVEMYAEGISFDQLTENLSKVDQKPATEKQKEKKPVALKKLHVVFQKDCDIVKKPETVNVAKPSLDSSAAQNRTRTQVTQDSVEETAPETAQLPEIKAVPSTVSTQQSTRSSGGGESSDSSDDSDDSEYDDEAPDEKCRLIDSDDKLARQPKFTYIRHENFEQKYARLIAGQPSQTLDEFYGKTVVDRELAGGDEKQLNHEIRKKARKVFWHRKALRDCVGPFKEVWEDFLETEDFHPEKWLKVFTSEFRGHGPYRHETHRPNGQLHPMPLQIVRMILKEARDAFKKDPAFLRLNGTVQVFGDLHGYFHDTVRQCHIGGFMTNTWLFLGDYVDRGAQGIDAVLFLCLCKLVSPDTVFLLRGNHEFEEMNKDYGFLDECKGAFGDKRGLVVFCDINTVFNQLSVCATINDKIFCVHGGISEELESGPDALEMIKKVPKTDKEKRLHQNLLWSDLVYGKGSYPQSTRSSELEMRNFTIGALRKVLKVQDWSYVLHGHNVKPEGYEENFRVILTIYSAPNTRCNPDDLSNNCGAFVIVGTDFVIRIVQFENWDTRVEGRVNTGAVTKIAELPE